MEKKCILLSVSQLKRTLPEALPEEALPEEALPEALQKKHYQKHYQKVNYGGWDCWIDSLPSEQRGRKTVRTQKE